jgi:uncharacterized protein
MKCPNCNVNLVMTDRSGIEIDYCPQCRGIWLDRGELDKIIERSTQHVPDRVAGYQENYGSSERDFGSRESDYRYKKKKKESFLGDLFDF